MRLTTTISFADMAEQFASIEYQWYIGNKFVDSSHIVFHNLKALSELVKHTQQMSKNHYLIDFFLLYIYDFILAFNPIDCKISSLTDHRQ